jgi:hypothetical protein
VQLHTVPIRDIATLENSRDEHEGFLQKVATGGNTTVLHWVHRWPSNAGSSPRVNHPSMAGMICCDN